MAHSGARRAIEVTCQVARENEAYGEFAGSDVIRRLLGEPGGAAIPNLRMLVSYGLLEKTGTARGHRRAYYRVVDLAGTEQALRLL